MLPVLRYFKEILCKYIPMWLVPIGMYYLIGISP